MAAAVASAAAAAAAAAASAVTDPASWPAAVPPSAVIESTWWLYLSQLPLAIYFLASLQDIPVDLAVLRLSTCYGLPLGLLVAFSYSPFYGLAACVGLWYIFTEAVPFAPIRLPSGQLREVIWRVLRLGRVGVLKTQEAPEANIFAVSAYVKLVFPFVAAINRLGGAISPARPRRILVGSDISWIFVMINWLDRSLFRLTKLHLIIPWSFRGMQKKAKAVRATPELNAEEDETLHAVMLFLNDMEKSVVGVSATGRLLINNLVLGMLDLRSTVQRYIMRHPEIVDIPVRAPIIILGMPRTGSTYLQALLAQDPNARHLRFWEMSHPVPPVERDKYHTDSRIEQVQAGIESIDIVSPTYRADMNKYHAFHSRAIEEELVLPHMRQLVLLHHHMMMFSHFYLTDDANGGSLFTDWLYNADNKGAMYRYLRRYVQLLSYRYPAQSHWILKAPLHTLYIAALLREFPDARIVNTHREPREIIPSWTKFQYQMLSIYIEIDAEPAKRFARHTLRMCGLMADRLLAYRKAMPVDQERKQFVDVRMDHLTSDPIGTIRAIYDRFDLPFTADFQRALEVYVAENGHREGGPPGARPGAPSKDGDPPSTMTPHQRSLALMGLSEEEIDERFKAYRQAYLA